MCVESAVEPTRSENITVTWRRSARSSGKALGVLDVVAASAEGGLLPASARRVAMASSSLRRCPSDATPSSLRSSSRQVRQDRLVYVILAEHRLILPEAQAPQPDRNVHEAPNSGLLHIIVGIRGECPGKALLGILKAGRSQGNLGFRAPEGTPASFVARLRYTAHNVDESGIASSYPTPAGADPPRQVSDQQSRAMNAAASPSLRNS